jgi:hypothetical protein
MALMKFGSLATDVRGSVGGLTFSKNRFGHYVRGRVKPVNPHSERQDNIRATMSSMRNIWDGTLTAEQRTAWNLYASKVSIQNKVGESVNATGYNQWCRTNVQLVYAGLARVDNAPIDFSLAEQDPTLAVITTISDGKVAVYFDRLLDWAHETGAYMTIFQGSPMARTINFFNGPWREIGSIAGVDGAAPASPQLFDVDFPIGLGQLQVCKARIIRKDGRASEPFTARCFVSGTPLVNPTAVGTYTGGVLTSILTFPQNMNVGALPAAGSFKYTGGACTALPHTTAVWTNATTLTLTVTTANSPVGTGALGYIPGTIPLLTAVGGIYGGFTIEEIVTVP